MRVILSVIAAFLILFAVYVAYQNRQYLITLLNPSVISIPETDNPTPIPTTVVKEFTITGTNFRFNPTEIRVNQGDEVKVTFQNTNGTHNWKIDEYNVETKNLRTGEQETISFIASQKGTFQYYCSVANHRAMGMVGNLIVQ